MNRVMHIAEVGLRVKDLEREVDFYREVLGFATVRAYPRYVFMEVGPLNSPLGRGGHSQLLVLFDRDVPLDIEVTTLDHLAFEVAPDAYDSERQRLVDLGFDVKERIWDGDLAWLRARSLFFKDPEGHTLELIAHTDDGRAG